MPMVLVEISEERKASLRAGDLLYPMPGVSNGGPWKVLSTHGEGRFAEVVAERDGLEHAFWAKYIDRIFAVEEMA